LFIKYFELLKPDRLCATRQ